MVIKVAWAGVNRPDALQRAGLYAPPPTASDLPGLEASGEVVAVGDGAVLENGDVRPMVLKVGDVVIFGQYSGNAVKIDGEELIIMNESEVYGVVE